MMQVDRRRLLVGAVAGLVSTRAYAATPSVPEAMALLMRQGLYLPLWLANRDASSDFAQICAAFVGDEARALRSKAANQEARLPELENATPSDALDYVVERAASVRVLVLNEAHSASRHRNFLRQLLVRLRPLGYRILACENFLNTQDLNAPDVRKYQGGALNPNFGFYIRDPVFAQAVRRGAELGYRFEAYDARADQRAPQDLPATEQVSYREQAQAENLAAVLRSAPSDDKIIVYCGFAHLREHADEGGRRWMAERLRILAGVDPLTVEQSMTGSVGPHAADTTQASAVLQRFKPTRPIVVRRGEEILGAAALAADIALFHPSLPDVNGRPGWLASSHDLVHVRRPLTGIAHSAPCLAQALHDDDVEAISIPADHHFVAKDEGYANFYLRPGHYRLRLETTSGQVLLDQFEVQA